MLKKTIVLTLFFSLFFMPGAGAAPQTRGEERAGHHTAHDTDDHDPGQIHGRGVLGPGRAQGHHSRHWKDNTGVNRLGGLVSGAPTALAKPVSRPANTRLCNGSVANQ